MENVNVYMITSTLNIKGKLGIFVNNLENHWKNKRSIGLKNKHPEKKERCGVKENYCHWIYGSGYTI